MFGLHLLELLVILVVVLVLFGPAKLPDLGHALGRAIRGFKKGLADDEPEKGKEPPRIGDGRDGADDGSPRG